jgi:hypothetical protein
MPTPTTEEIVQIQNQTREINSRLKADPTLRAKYAADPTGFLTTAGLPAAAAHSLVALINRDADGDEVSGYDMNDDFYTGYPHGDRDTLGFTIHF